MRLRPGLVAALLAVPAAAAAGELTAARETACTATVELTGPIATVIETHELTGLEPTPAEARYQFELPDGAAVTDARVGVGSDAAPAAVVSAGAVTTETPDAERLGLAPDRGLVRWLGGGSYEARVYPVAAGTASRLTLRWIAAAAYRDGRLVLELPARGDSAALARCEVTVKARPGAGIARFARAFVGGMAVAAIGGHAELGNATATAIELVPTWRGRGPVAATLSTAVPGDRAVTTVALYLPPRAVPATFAPPRLLLVVDTTRSMGADGRAAAVAIADALVAAVPAATPVAAIGFDREARPLYPGWVKASAARPALRDALTGAAPGGGTDLAAALNLAAATVGEEPTRVVVITDALLSTQVTAADLQGAAMMPASTAVLDVIAPVVPGAPLPDRAALEPLAAAFHGKLVVVRTAEVAEVAAALPRRLAEDLPLRDPSVTVDGEAMGFALPDQLAPGTGVVVHASHAGPPARAVRVVGLRGPAAVTATAVALARPAAALQVLAAARGQVAVDTARLDDADALALARRTPTVTPGAALAVIDPRGPGAAARLELARASGAFTRTPPPGAAELARPVDDDDDAPAPRVDDDNLPASTYQYLIKYQLWPAVRTCYADALRGQPRFTGTLDVTLEIARGEVAAARFGGTPLPSGFVACVARAAYAIEVPTYGLDGLSPSIAVIHKPIHLHLEDDQVTPRLDDLGFPDEEAPPPPLE